MSEKTDEKALAHTRFAPTDLRNLDSFQAALDLLNSSGVGVVDATDEIGDGFTMLETHDKDTLINVPFVVLAWVFAKGDYDDDYCIARLVTGDGKRLVLTDGGTGICAQMKEFTERTGRTGGLLVQRGLRKSEYENEFGPGVTHYLNV